MKLFVFRPKQYGPQTYMVMSETQEQARILVFDEMIKNNDVPPHYDIAFEYKMEIYEADQVATNPNS